ncbi:MAG: GTPase HflX [Oscillospiraceae bacterium]|nr:GTPase HflX [Oscillospiraceae bacterium]
MTNMTNETKTNAILVCLDLGDYDAESSLKELEELAITAGANVAATVTQKRAASNKATVVGAGKIKEIAELCQTLDVELIVFDTELSASQIRNIEKITEVRVIDRTMLILDIFAGRAVSKEGKLQVELAQLRYRLPRLAGMGVSMSRQGGHGQGIGTRGPGETRLETDRRHIRRRIQRLSEELRELEHRRKISRSRRKKEQVLTGAIVGYTNAGKSTLLNCLTDAGVLAEDKLFATLDLTSRAILLPDGRSLLLIDTVGLIRRLPHNLIEAFKSTLEEAANADIILHVCDISDPETGEKAQTARELLNELGCGGIPSVTIMNKCDKFPNDYPESDTLVKISAKSGFGIPRMLEIISKNLPEKHREMSLLFPYDKAGLAAKIRQNGKILSEEYNENGLLINALVEIKLTGEMEQYLFQ